VTEGRILYVMRNVIICTLSNVVRIRHVACVTEMRNTYSTTFKFEIVKGRDHLAELRINWGIMLEWKFREVW
jgi:hypothetical protein